MAGTDPVMRIGDAGAETVQRREVTPCTYSDVEGHISMRQPWTLQVVHCLHEAMEKAQWGNGLMAQLGAADVSGFLALRAFRPS